MKTQNVRALTECSIMIALSTVLSVFLLFEMPYGGSVTPASMLPVLILAYRHGTKWGVGSALVASLLQALLGLKNFSYFTSPQSIVALLVFDYILAFAVFGAFGFLRRKTKGQLTAILSSAVFASVLRYICHVISGATIWAGLSIPTEAALIYSISYNATYMLPETIILTLATFYLCSSLDFSHDLPRRIRTENEDKLSSGVSVCSSLIFFVLLVVDVKLLFPYLQGESGEFSFENIASANIPLIIILAVIAVLVFVGARVYLHIRAKKNARNQI